MLTVEQHLACVLAECAALEPQPVPLRPALGRILAESIAARHPLPPFDNAAMDGYAVHSEDVEAASASAPARLRVVADIAAGSPLDPRLQLGEAARIMTGAAIPTDADTIVPLEDTSAGVAFPAEGVVEVTRATALGAHVRRAGEEVSQGQVVLQDGMLLTPRRLAAAAAVGHSALLVHPSPRVAVIATGDELVVPGSSLGRGQLAESNSTLLASLVTAAGGEVAHTAVVGDDPSVLRTVIAGVRNSVDLVLLAGGVGSGAYDVVRLAFADVLSFHQLAMQPGRPQAFGRLPDGPLVFGLPGNPVATAVSFDVFVRPAIARLRGLSGESRVFTAAAASGWRSRVDRRTYLPVVVEDGCVRPAGAGRSHFVASLARADGYAIAPVGIAVVERGDSVEVLRASGDA